MRTASLLAAFALAGCLAADEGPADLATLPDEGPFVFFVSGCGLQPHPMGNLVVIDADGVLAHVALERAERPTRVADPGIDEDDVDASIRAARDSRVAEGTYNAAWLDENATATHAERIPLDESSFRKLRALVSAADFANLSRHYDGDTSIADGCGYGYAVATDKGFVAVSAIDDGGPPALDNLRAWLLAAHVQEP